MRGVWLKGDFFSEFLNYLQILPILMLNSALDEKIVRNEVEDCVSLYMDSKPELLNLLRSKDMIV